MTEILHSLDAIADKFGAIVLDQWGVLHDGTDPYPGVVEALTQLRARGMLLAVLSNSGKRAAPNADRIASVGYDPALFETVMTSGEALWQDIVAGRVTERVFVAIERAPGDAIRWAKGLDVTLTASVNVAEAVLLMGLPDGAVETEFDAVLAAAYDRNLPLLCTNPDRASPRADGCVVVSPGALAHKYADDGGVVRFYGKPHAPVFRALETTLGATPQRLLMVGDSLEHDIAGGQGAGWSTLFVEGGLHAAAFDGADPKDALAALIAREGNTTPDYTIARLQ